MYNHVIEHSFRRIARVAVVSLAVSAAAIGLRPATATAGVVGDAADWLLTEQVGDGSFPWTSGGAVFNNTQGATALGLIGAYEKTGNTAYRDAAKDNGDYILGPSYGKYSDNDPRFSTHDPMFLEVLSDVTGDSSYANFVQTNFWDKLTSGTYGETNDLDAAGFGNAVVVGRTGQGIVELSPWDLSKTAIAAEIAGEIAIRNAMMLAIRDGLEATGVTDTTFDLHGLAGAIWASAVTGVDLDPVIGRYSAADSTEGLITDLLAFINADGGWVFNSTADLLDLTNGDAQVTAFAILALHAFDAEDFSTEISNGLDYLASLQQLSGQILAFPGASTTTSGGVEVHGEALYTLATAMDPAAVPEPGTIATFALGLIGLGVIRRRRIV